MKRLATALIAVGLVSAVHPAWAKKKAPATDDDSDSASSDDDDGDAKPAKKTAKKKGAKKKKDPDADKPAEKEPAKEEKAAATADEDNTAGDEDEGKKKKDDKSDPDEDVKKQDLTGHDLGTKKKTNEFEKDRFYVDKQDTEKTEAATLIQGSITSTSFYYSESGGAYPGQAAGQLTPSTSNSDFKRMFTDLRIQTDFRHIKGGEWDGRIDARLRFVDQPTDNSGPLPGTTASTEPKIQSGLTGQNEYDIRELWLVRNGKRSDVTIGRQYIADLAAVKIDGLRIDYAQSSKFTLLGFGGLLPLRGSRSLTTDYIQDNFVDANGNRQPAGRFTTAGGFGAAYRTLDTYGAFGGVIEAPLSGEQPRVFATSNGYWRYGTKLDLYHFVVVDLVGDQATNGSHLTNVSLGANFKPNPRLRLTASYNRVDNETLSIQAGAFLNSGDASLNFVDNETYLQRLSTNEVRGSASAGLGPLERFEVTGALSFKYRPTVTLDAVGGGLNTATPIKLQAEEGGEFDASITDRHSIKDARLALDIVQTFGLGGATYQHSQLFAIRASGAHAIKNGQGEVEAEIAYTKASDSAITGTCIPTMLDACFGDSVTSLLSVGGSVFYRINRDWLGLASLYVTSENLVRNNGAGVATPDPGILGLAGFIRASYRF